MSTELAMETKQAMVPKAARMEKIGVAKMDGETKLVRTRRSGMIAGVTRANGSISQMASMTRAITPRIGTRAGVTRANGLISPKTLKTRNPITPRKLTTPRKTKTGRSQVSGVEARPRPG